LVAAGPILFLGWCRGLDDVAWRKVKLVKKYAECKALVDTPRLRCARGVAAMVPLTLLPRLTSLSNGDGRRFKEQIGFHRGVEKMNPSFRWSISTYV
jgi:hypothetical protein